MKEAKVVPSARDDDGVRADVGDDCDHRTELVGAILLGACGGGGGGGGGGRRGRHAVGTGGRAATISGRSGARLAGDQLREQRGSLGGVGVAEEDHIGLRIGIRSRVEGFDQLIEERVLIGGAHDDDAVGALVGGEAGARRKAEGRGAIGGRRPQEGRQLVHHIGGHGVLQVIQLGRNDIELRAIELGEHGLNLLQVHDRVGDQNRVIPTEEDWRRAERAVKHPLDLQDNLLAVGVLEQEDFGSHAAARGQGKRALAEQRRGLCLGDVVRDDLKELITLLDDGDAVQGEQRLDGQECVVARGGGWKREGVEAGGERLRTEDRLTGPALEQFEHLADGLIAEDHGADLIGTAQAGHGRRRDGADDHGRRRGGSHRRGSWCRRLGKADGG